MTDALSEKLAGLGGNRHQFRNAFDDIADRVNVVNISALCLFSLATNFSRSVADVDSCVDSLEAVGVRVSTDGDENSVDLDLLILAVDDQINDCFARSVILADLLDSGLGHDFDAFFFHVRHDLF
jgi:hypothetical protein